MNRRNDEVESSVVAPDNVGSRASDFAIGLFSFVALLCFAGAWMWLKSVPLWNPAQRVSVLFHDVAGLNPNAAVYADGVRIGSVENISLQAKRKVLVRLKVNTDSVHVLEGTAFDIRTNGVVGARYIDVTLPDAGQTSGKLLTPNHIVWGHDPVRTEVLLDKVATNLGTVDFNEMQYSVNSSLQHLSSAADNLSGLSRKLQPAADRALLVEDKIALLACDLRGTNARLNKLLRDPSLANELRGTLGQLNETTAHVERSVDKLEKLAENQSLRADLKQVIGDARETVAQVHALVSDPAFGSEMKGTMVTAQSALARLDLVGEQMNRILSRRAPLLQLFFGRPGLIRHEQTAGCLEAVPQ